MSLDDFKQGDTATLPRLMKPGEVAEALQVSMATVYRLAALPDNGFPPAAKFGQQLRFRHDDVDSYIARQFNAS